MHGKYECLYSLSFMNIRECMCNDLQKYIKMYSNRLHSKQRWLIKKTYVHCTFTKLFTISLIKSNYYAKHIKKDINNTEFKTNAMASYCIFTLSTCAIYSARFIQQAYCSTVLFFFLMKEGSNIINNCITTHNNTSKNCIFDGKSNQSIFTWKSE